MTVALHVNCRGASGISRGVQRILRPHCIHHGLTCNEKSARRRRTRQEYSDFHTAPLVRQTASSFTTHEVMSILVHQVDESDTRCDTTPSVCPEHRERAVIPRSRPDDGGGAPAGGKPNRQGLLPQFKVFGADVVGKSRSGGALVNLVSNNLNLDTDPGTHRISGGRGSWWFQGLIFTGLWVIGHEVG